MGSFRALPAIALLSLTVGGCSNAHKETTSSQPSASSGRSSTTQTKTASGAASNAPSTAKNASASVNTSPGADAEDGDADAGRNDDEGVLNYGHPADPTDTRMVSATVRAYYAAAVADEGARACSLIFSLQAEEVIPETYSRQSRSGTPPVEEPCAVVMSRLFKQEHHHLAAKTPTLEVTGVRVEGPLALALLSFAATPGPHDIKLRREGDTWRINELFDNGLP